MIARLRRRMTLLVLAGLLIIISGVVFSINYMNWRNITSQAAAALESLVQNRGFRPTIGFGGPNPGLFTRDGQADQAADTGQTEQAGDANADLTDAGQADLPNAEWTAQVTDDATVDQIAAEKSTESSASVQPFAGRGGRNRADAAGWHEPGQPPESENVLASLSNYYVIYLSEDGDVTEWSSDRSDLYTDEQIDSIAEAALASGKESGRVGTQFFRFVEETFPFKENSDTAMIVLDERLEILGFKRVLRMTILVAAIAYLVLAAASYCLIRRMIRPVAEAFDKQKQFIWDASHEMKTPLAVIGANAQVLQDEIGENEYLGYISSEVTRTNDLLQNLLTLARMDKGSVTAQLEEIDLGRTILSVALPFESNAFEAGREFITDIPDGLRCRADASMIQQLVMILLSNALKYSNEGGSITVKAESRGKYCALLVRNTGAGIAPEDLERIFDRFYRADISHNREVEGFGLGLSIAKDIVDAHHGKIWAESTVGSETVFTVLLPV